MSRARGGPRERDRPEYDVPEPEESDFIWDPADEVVQVQESVSWLKSPNDCLPSSTEMDSWLQTGPKKLDIEDETQFCHENLVTRVFHAKKIRLNFGETWKVKTAQKRYDPCGKIGSAIFFNRSALKMANIDKACDFMFTRPEGLQNNELLYFADVCAGPGSFSEYVLWRKKWYAKGFGLTLKNDEDFELNKFRAGPCETLHPYYGPRTTGDACIPENQEGFRELIMTHTHGKGVHFMMSDGHLLSIDHKLLREIRFKQLYLCQCLIALMVVREKGHFATILFDIYTPFSAGIVYLMYRCFEEICIIKPNATRPANSERFLICKSKRPGTENVIRYLKHVNNLLLENNDNNDVIQLVSFDELRRENRFLQYLRTSNERIAKNQIVSLRKFAAFCNNFNLVEERQDNMREECLKYWEIPRETRDEYLKKNCFSSKCETPNDNFKAFFGDQTIFVFPALKELSNKNINKILSDSHDWCCMRCSTGPLTKDCERCTLYMGVGRSDVYRLIKRTWMKVDGITVELSPNTLVYAEVVHETMKKKPWKEVAALHIVDAFVLGGEDITHLRFRDRIQLAKQFCEALRKPPGTTYNCVRVKELLTVDPNLCETLQLKSRRMKDGKWASVYEFPTTPLDYNSSDNYKPYFRVNNIIFVKNKPADCTAGNCYNILNEILWCDITRFYEKIAQLIKKKLSASAVVNQMSAMSLHGTSESSKM